MAPTWPTHVLLAWGGLLGDPSLDVWTNTVKLQAVGPLAGDLTVEQQEIFANAMIGVLTPLHQTVLANSQGGLWNESARFQWIKLNTIGHDGRYFHDTTTVVDLGTEVLGSGHTSNWRVSLATSFTTAKARGRAHIGRIYPVGTEVGGTQTAGSPYVSAADADAARDAVILAFETIKALTVVPDVQLVPVNVSPDPTGATGGYMETITGVEVDRVLDTQRRRTNRVPRLVESGPVS